MNKQLVLVLVLCISAMAQSTSCPGFNGNDLLQSGKNAIMRGKIGGTPEYSYDAPINFKIPSWGLEIAVSTSTIGDYNPLQTYGYNYYIEASRKGTSNSITYKLIMNNDESWTSIQLSYLVSGREDIAAGNFEVPVNQWKSSSSNVYQISNKISRTLPQANYKVAAFISGFSTVDSQFGLTVNQKIYDADTKRVNITFYSSANPSVLTVTITYVIYPEIHAVLDFTYSLTPKGDTGSYQISGPVNFQPNKRIQYNEWRVENRNLPCTGDKCTNICVLREECSQKGGSIYEGQCYYCGEGIIFEYGQCTRRCGMNQIYLNRVCICATGFTRKGKDCVGEKKCGTNEIWSDSLNACTCNKGCARFIEECKECPTGSEPTSDGKSCVCKDTNTIFDNKTLTCKPRCLANQQWVNNRCQCVVNHCWWNQVCRVCPSNSDVSKDQTTCVCKSTNAFFNAQTNLCVECKANEILNDNSNQCVCKTGFTKVNGVCTVSCKDNEILDTKTNTCACKDGFVLQGSVCKSKCAATIELWDGKACVCAANYVKYNNVCKQCPTGSTANSAKTACVCSNANQIFSETSFKCETCQDNASPNAAKTACACKTGYIAKGNLCVLDCKSPEVLSADNKICECIFGYERKSSGKCQLRCTNNQVWDGKVCVCSEGFARYNTVCRQCPAGSTVNSDKTACVCSNANQIFDATKFSCENCQANAIPNSNKTSCICNTGYVLNGAVCIPNCKELQVLSADKTSCQCKDGYVRSTNGNCQTKCDANSEIWDGKVCVCAANYAKYNNVCKQCPTGSAPNAAKTACVCTNTNSIFNPTKFVCEVCQANSAPNANKDSCVCNTGYSLKNGVCTLDCKQYEVLSADGKVCDCQSDYVRTNGVCQPRCTVANEVWNGKACVCVANFARYSNVCRQCPTGSAPNADQTACVCSVANSIFNPTKFVCEVCQSNSAPNANKDTCVCNSGYVLKNGVCTLDCKQYEVLSADGKVCECQDDYVRTNGVCQPRCTVANEVWNGKACVCVVNFARYNNVCRQCPTGSAPNADQTACVCSINSSIFNPTKFVCEVCQANSAPNANRDTCVCNAGYVLKNGVCTLDCKQYEVISNDGKTCECQDDYVRTNGVCQPRCTVANEIWNGKACVCVVNFARYSNVCRQCPTGSAPNADQTACVCSASNSIFNPTKFVCEVCQSNSAPNANRDTCVCNTGYSLKNGVCTLDCKQYEVLSADGKVCDCQDDYVRTNGVCQPRCTVANEVWNGKACVCVVNFARYSNVCRQCPTGSAPNADQTACVCSVANSIFNPTKFVCEVCPTNSSPNANKDTCVCNSGFLAGTNGICVRDCKDPFVLNVITGNCECKSGFVADGNTCKSRCLTGETWQNNACICAQGSAKYTTCRVCPTGTLPNAARTACICTGANQIFQSDKFSCLTCPTNSKPNVNFTECVCNEGFTKSGSTCVLNCGVNEVANNEVGKCECIFGYIKTSANGTCTPRCKANQEYNGNQCICKPGCGYFKNQCTVCPTDATSNPSRSSCLCIAPNFIFNTTTYKCQSCPVFSTNNDDDTKCICNNGYELVGSQCVPTCEVNEELTKDNICDCKWGFMRLGPMCVERCGLNNEWNGTICKCKQNYVYQNYACRACPDGMLTNPARTTCLCKNSSSIFDFDTFKCVAFPENCKPCEDYSCFECLPGYKKQNKTCVNTCPSGSFPDPTGTCVCAGGNYFEGGVCKKPVTCPAQSTWSTTSLECVCDNKSQNIIDGACKACGANSIFSVQSKKCICQTGFFSIAGECRTCDARTRYDGNDCICSWGYYGNRDKCNQCHASCNTCTGPEANQCITCSDVSLVLQNGFCSRNTPCNPGFFLDSTYTQSCQKCTDNCIICDNIFECQNCAVGYKQEKYDIAGQKIVACAEVCGDGIRYEAECDDGNTVNGDGCSSTCNKQPGWECTGGSSAQKSTCKKFIPDSTYLEAKGAANLGGKVVQSIRANYLPTCLTQNECAKCFRALKVSVVDANVPILVTVQYIYSSQYQFLIEYDFQGLYVTSKFKTLIKLNDEFKGCLADEDFNNQLELTIDPAFLAKFDEQTELTLEDIIDDSAISVPKSAKALLGLN